MHVVAVDQSEIERAAPWLLIERLPCVMSMMRTQSEAKYRG